MKPDAIFDFGTVTGTFYIKECLEVMATLPDQSVDLIFCDLPYGTTRNAWDSVIPFDLLWEQYKRLLKPTGTVVLTAQGLFTAQLMLSNTDWFKYKLVWVKSKHTNFLNAKKQPLRNHEDVLVYAPGLGTYNAQKWQGKPYKVQSGNGSSNYGKYNSQLTDNPTGERWPLDTWYSYDAQSERESIALGTFHPTQKSMGLSRALVKTYSNLGDVVLDNCMGSGSFVIAALIEGRNAIGIEMSESIQKKANDVSPTLDIIEQRLAWHWDNPGEDYFHTSVKEVQDYTMTDVNQ